MVRRAAVGHRGRVQDLRRVVQGPEHLAEVQEAARGGGEYSHRREFRRGGRLSADERQTSEPRLPSEVWVLITANVVIALGYGVVAPVLPQYARNFGVSISAATFVITAFAADAAVFRAGQRLLVQRLGERRVYREWLLIVAVSTGACAFAQTYWQLLLFRSLGGFGSTMFFVSSLGLMIRISPDGRPRSGRGHVLQRVPGRLGRRPGDGQPDRRSGSGRAVPDLRRRTADRRGGGVRQPAAFASGGAGASRPNRR